MRRIKQVLREMAWTRRGRSVTALHADVAVPKTCWLEWLNGTRELKPAAFERVEEFLRTKLKITMPWVQLEAIVPDDELTLKARVQQGQAPAANEQDDHSERRRLMLTRGVLAHFGLRCDPFAHAVDDADGVFLSPVHRAVFDEVLDAAQFGRFCALIAEVGFGKTILRKLMIERVKARGHGVCVVEQLDRESLTISRVMDALLMDFAGQKAGRSGREAQTRRVKEMLTTIHDQGKPCTVLIVDEAHALHSSTLRGLKRLFEIEDGFRKLLSIVLFGQPSMFSRLGSFDLEEVSSRLDIVLAYGMDTVAKQGPNGPEPHRPKRAKSAVPDYIAFKLKRAGAKAPEKVIELDAAAAIGKITDVPLRINVWCARALNLAYELSYPAVTREVVEQLNQGGEA